MAPRKVSPAPRVPAKKRSAAPKVAPRARAVKRAPTPSSDEVIAPAPPTAEQIQLRAYFLHLERQGRPGDPVADWIQAEQELAGITRER